MANEKLGRLFVKQLKYICENAEDIKYIKNHKDYDKILQFLISIYRFIIMPGKTIIIGIH